MSLTATFPAGVANITVNGLHQWDYGQQLKIKAADLPAMFEVHFACVGMDEAIVRPCSMTGGEGTVTIPDKCLEQTSPVYAWIYEIDGTVGTTTKTILLNIIARARPQIGEDIPVDISNQYAEAVTTMNAKVTEMGALVDEMESLVEQVSEGQLPMSYAAQAGHATTAGNATTADHAESARTADGLNTKQAFKKPDIHNYNEVLLQSTGYYLVTFNNNGIQYPVVIYFDNAIVNAGTPIIVELINVSSTSKYYLRVDFPEGDKVLSVWEGTSPSQAEPLGFTTYQSLSVALIHSV